MDEIVSQQPNRKRKLSEQSNDNDSLQRAVERRITKRTQRVRDATWSDIEQWRKRISMLDIKLAHLRSALTTAANSEEIDKISKSIVGALSDKNGHQQLLQMCEQYQSLHRSSMCDNSRSCCTDQQNNAAQTGTSDSLTNLHTKRPATSGCVSKTTMPPQLGGYHGSSILDSEEVVQDADCLDTGSDQDVASSFKPVANSSRQRHGSSQFQFHKPTTDILMSGWAGDDEVPMVSRAKRQNPIYFYEESQLWIRNKDGVGIVLGIEVHRRAQIERETDTKIIYFRENRITSSGRDAYTLFRIEGDPGAISKARSIIEKLLGDGKNSFLERQRLDAAAQAYSLPQQMLDRTGLMEPQPTLLQSNDRIHAKLSTRPKPTKPTSVRSVNQPPPVMTAAAKKTSATVLTVNPSSKPMLLKTTPSKGPPNLPQKLTRFTLGETDDESSSSSSASDSDSDSSSDDGSESDSGSESESEPESELRKTNSPLSFTHHDQLIPCTTDELTTGTSERVVIKIEDDTEDEDSLVLQTPETYRQENLFGNVPTTGNMKVSEVKRMLELRDAKAAQLAQRVKILEYALHFKGVSDFAITRMHARTGEKGRWDEKFTEILGHPRIGNEKDGEPLTPADRTRLQSGLTKPGTSR